MRRVSAVLLLVALVPIAALLCLRTVFLTAAAAAAAQEPTNNAQCFSASIKFCANWTITYDSAGTPEVLTLTVEAATPGWIGIGFSQTATSYMSHADIITAYVNDTTGEVVVEDRFLNATKGYPPLDTAQGGYSNVELVSGYQTATATSITFRRLFVTNDTYYDRALHNGTTNIIFAWGNTDVFGYHYQNTGTGAVNFESGKPAPQPKPTGKYLMWAHAICMGIAWALCASLGIAVARFMKKTLGHPWFYLHIILQTLAVILTITGFIIILVKAKSAIAPPGLETHFIFGWIVVIGSIIQPILGVVADRMYKKDRDGPPIFPDKIHWWIGNAMWLLGLANIYLGLSIVGAHWAFFTAYWAWIFILIGMFVLNPEHDNTHGKEKKKKKNNNNNKKNKIYDDEERGYSAAVQGGAYERDPLVRVNSAL